MSSNTNSHSDSFPLIHARKTADGLSKPLACDGNGNLNSVVVNSVNVAPANSVNGELTPTQSFNVKVANTNNLNFKLEDLSSSINSDNAGHTRSIAVGVRGYTDPDDRSTGKFLKCGADGVLNTHSVLQDLRLASIVANTNILRDTQNITTDYNGSNLSGSLGGGVATSSCDLENHKHIHILLDGSGGGGNLTIEGSHTNTNTSYHLVDEIHPSLLGGGNPTTYKHKITNATYRYYRIKNNSGAPITFTNFKFTKLNL